MSEYGKATTKFRDEECLLGALADVGYDKVEVHKDAQQLIDYHGRPTHYLHADGDKAHIIVRRRYVGGAANDLGFFREADGTYSAIISAYDRGKHNAQWMIGLKQKYADRIIPKTAKKFNLTLMQKTQVGQKKVIRYSAR